MKRMIFFLQIFDYIKTRKNLAQKFVVSLIPALAILIYALFFNVRNGIDISQVFTNFVSVQVFNERPDLFLDYHIHKKTPPI